MPTSVRVDDYYDNNENGLWSWYLKNIRSGDFEELTTNELKYTLLKRYLNSNIYNNAKPIDKNKKILLISIPDKVHSDISILETFLKDYFHLEDLQNIKIQKLTQDHCYNHENHYLLIDQMNNFNDPTFLNYVDPKRYNKLKDETTISKNENELEEEQTEQAEIVPETTLHDESGNELVSQENDKIVVSSNNNSTSINSASPTVETSFSSNNTDSITTDSNNNNNNNNNTTNNSNNFTNSSIISDDAASSIVLNFPRAPLHHIRHTQDNNTNISSSPVGSSNNSNNPKKGMKRDSVDSLLHSVFTNGNNGHSFTPPGSELVSINSFYNDEEGEEGSFVEEDDHTVNKHPLTRMITPEEEEVRESEKLEQDLSPLSNGLTESDLIPTTSSITSATNNTNNKDDNESFVSSVSSDSYSSYSTSSSTSSYYSILPSISINDQCGHFRLVLQSALLYNENKEIFTAIRQSNNVVNKASVKDDWILYDSEFSMNNLMMLTLKELFEFGHDIPKILFYSMVIVDPLLTDKEINDSPQLTDEDIIKVSNEFNDQLEIKEEDSDNELFEDNPNINPEMLYDEDEPKMYIPERMISNVTTAGHRSIRTVNSIGEWAYRKKSNISGITYDDDTNSNKSSNIIDKNEKQLDLERKNKIERWKSLPNHGDKSDSKNNQSINKQTSNNGNNRSTGHKNKRYNDGIIHSGGERWKLNMKRFKKSSDRKKEEEDKFCIIM